MTMFCLLDDKGVIHISESQLGVNNRPNGLSFELFHEQFCNEGG